MTENEINEIMKEKNHVFVASFHHLTSCKHVKKNKTQCKSIPISKIWGWGELDSQSNIIDYYFFIFSFEIYILF